MGNILNVEYWNRMSEERKRFLLQRANQAMHDVATQVKEWLDKIRRDGDKAVIEYIKQFDGVELKPSELRVDREEMERAFQNLDEHVKNILKKQIVYSRHFHSKQMQTADSWITQPHPGIVVGVKKRPVGSAGLYVPGGTAKYPTTAHLLGVAASTAGVKRIAMNLVPKQGMDIVMGAAYLAGVHEMYRVSGVAAIGAFAYGTETVPKVDVIAGPGNIYVNAAKKEVFGEVAVDMIAGPSETLVLADRSARPDVVAMDLLASAEHDVNAASVLVTPSESLAVETCSYVERLLAERARKHIIEQALQRYCAIIVTRDMEEAYDLVNRYAPEHLQLMIEEPWEGLERVENAGSIFLGAYSPVAIGDYASGVNHVLPTGRAANAFSGVSVETFLKHIEFEYITKSGLTELEPIVGTLAPIEQLEAHYASVKIRLEDK